MPKSPDKAGAPNVLWVSIRFHFLSFCGISASANSHFEARNRCMKHVLDEMDTAEYPTPSLPHLRPARHRNRTPDVPHIRE
jgi:hypothetical protein